MAAVAPLRGVRFNTDKAGALDELVTPPYDIINENAEQAFIGRSPYNIIRLDITKEPGNSRRGEPGRYAAAAQLLDDWLDQGILIRDAEEAFYPYDITYVLPNGSRRTRKGFIGQIELAEFSEGIVKPHEKTFESVIQDRLELTRHCRAQFSQVFSLFSDRDNQVIAALDAVRGKPIATVTDGDGCIHRLWKVSDGACVRAVRRLFADKAVYIADGHHRYTTALAYRNELRSSAAAFSRSRPENHIMMYFCPMEDVGLSILPTHRMVRYPERISMAELLIRLDRHFSVQEITGSSRETLAIDLLAHMDEASAAGEAADVSSFGLYHPREDRGFMLRLREKAANALIGQPRQLRDLDVVILSTLIVGEVLELEPRRCERDNLVTFHSDLAEALDRAVKDSALDEEVTPLLFLMNPTRVEQVRRVADDGLIMPHKSTYFYPKIVTGLVLNKLIDTEEITGSE